MTEYIPSPKYQEMQRRKKLKRRHRRRQLLALLILIILLAAIVFALMYIFKAPLFDRSGVVTDENGNTSLLDYHGKPLSGWQTIDGQELYFDPETCYLVSGWTEYGGALRYFENGQLQTGYITIDGDTYLLNDDSTPYSGWLEDNGDRYYYHADGKMAVGEVVIDGITRHFTSAGKYVLVVNRWNPIPDDYVLVLDEVEGFEISAECSAPLLDMMEACRDAGHICELNSTYRSVEVQQWLWDNRYYMNIDEGYSEEESFDRTVAIVAYPGTSEHNLGLAVDIIGTDEMYEWLAQNSWKYGFTLRYPDGKTDYTSTSYEPWHFRYVGTELAKELYDLDMCMEEYMEMLTNR